MTLVKDYAVCGHETFLTDCSFGKPSSQVIAAYPWLFYKSGDSFAIIELFGCKFAKTS